MSDITWRQEAAHIIAHAVRGLPDDAPLHERQRVVDAARPAGWMHMSWPRKAWQAARRDYLVRYGYQPRTKKARGAESAGMPLFEGERG